MAHALYAVMLVTPADATKVRRYLYGPTEVVESALVRREERPDLCFLILRTEERDAVRTEHSQQQQADRFASGMMGMVNGFHTRHDAQEHARSRAYDNDWALGDFTSFVLTAE